MLYSDTVYCSRQPTGGSPTQNDKRQKIKVVINSNFRPGTKISGQLDHSMMHNRLCGIPPESEMFPGILVLRN